MLKNITEKAKAYINTRIAKHLQKTPKYEGSLIVTLLNGNEVTVEKFESFQRPVPGKLLEFYDCGTGWWTFGTVRAFTRII